MSRIANFNSTFKQCLYKIVMITIVCSSDLSLLNGLLDPFVFNGLRCCSYKVLWIESFLENLKISPFYLEEKGVGYPYLQFYSVKVILRLWLGELYGYMVVAIG